MIVVCLNFLFPRHQACHNLSLMIPYALPFFESTTPSQGHIRGNIVDNNGLVIDFVFTNVLQIASKTKGLADIVCMAISGEYVKQGP